jgi:putative heme iron utilization protein
MQGTQVTDPALAARQLLRATRSATLATDDAGQPFASLITPATAVDGSLLMLLSGLSPHTRHLRAQPRCSVLAIGAPTGRNPQTAPRLTLVGAAAPEPDPALKARWVALHPYAAFYADLGDFELWHFRASWGQFVGGFGSAHRLRGAELQSAPDQAATIGGAEPELLQYWNGKGALLDRVAASLGGAGEGWQLVACDPDGADLARGEQVLRLAFPAPTRNAGDFNAGLHSFCEEFRRAGA